MENNISSVIRLYSQLAKTRITIAVTITTIAGYSIHHGGFSDRMILPSLGLFLIACGSAVLNQVQEIKRDSMMERTKNRPLPSGSVSIASAIVFTLLLVLTGTIILYFSSGPIATLLALAALVWYNLIYTYLKKITAFAVIPGSVIGAIPPAVGWTAAGGRIDDPVLWIVCFFFFMWQVPHFWLLLLKFGKQYEQAGFPSLSNVYSNRQLQNITFVWIIAMLASGLFLIYFPATYTQFSKIAITVISALAGIFFISLILKNDVQNKMRKYFMVINIYMLTIVFFLIVDSFAR